MDNRLFLLLQQLDKFLFCADVAPDASVDVVKVADNGGLFIAMVAMAFSHSNTSIS